MESLKLNYKTCYMALILLVLCSLPVLVLAQNSNVVVPDKPTATITQTLKGRVVDMASQYTIIGAIVSVVGLANLAAVTDQEGNFSIKGAPIGRCAIKVTATGYQDRSVPNILITSGKQMYQDIELEESLAGSKEVSEIEIKAGGIDANPTKAQHEMAFVSARSFNVEETMRFSGSRNDPARMASNFAGVQINNDGRNDIIIRGNSPTGMLWRMDGLDIPNPNHFGAIGATGGPVSILNNNTLAKSDFLTSAFPAEYGNANAGVFDLQLRRGNRDKREYMGQVGFNGFEAGAEGPLGKPGGRSSFLINYRYSTLGLFNKIGIKFGTGAAIPNYQDVTFKTSIGVGKAAKIDIFGIGGLSAIHFKGRDYDTTNLYSGVRQDLDAKNSVGIIGASYLHFFNNNTYGKFTIGASGNTAISNLDSLSPDFKAQIKTYRNNSSSTKLSARYVFNHKFSAKTTLQAGAYVDRLGFAFKDSALTNVVPVIGPSYNAFRGMHSSSGSTILTQQFVQGSYRFTDVLTGTLGIHAQTLTLTNTTAIEPRAGFKYQISDRTALTAGYGLHNQIQPLAAYFTQSSNNASGSEVLNNTKLGFTKSNQFVVGASHALTPETRFKIEAYYQALSNVPVNRSPSAFSMLNFGADFNFPDFDSLTNTGKGRNYGVELTLERNYTRGYYYLLTSSIFNSEYQGSDGIWRNTAFNSKYVLNGLAGKEWKLSPKYTFAFDTKITTSGGRFYTSYDVAASIAAGRAVAKTSETYGAQFPVYFRLDTKFTLRLNSKGVTQEFFIDIQNVTNHFNAFAKTWNADKGKEVTIPQLGLFPNINYRILF